MNNSDFMSPLLLMVKEFLVMWKFILRRKTGKSTDTQIIPPKKGYLHVVLYPPKNKSEGRSIRGNKIPTFVLLPHHSNEEFAEDDAMEKLSGR